MGLLNFSRKAHENAHPANQEVVAGSTEADADIDTREVYFLIMHFLSSGPCQRTFGQIWNELLEHDLLPRRYHAWHSRSGSRSGNEDDNGHSLPLSYIDLVSRHPHIETNHLVKLLKQLILCSSPSNGSLGGASTSGVDISSLLGSGAFSLLGSDKTREVKKATHLPLYLRWPHIQANQVHGLSLREIGGGFSKHCRAPSIRAACYAIAKPSTMVQKMEDIRKLRGHQNAVYCAIFDRSGRHVITGSDDRLVKIWSMETAFCLSSCRGHEGDITDLAVSSNNALVASASNDFSIRIWRLPDGLPISVLKGHTGGVTAIAFSPRPVTMYHLLSSSDDGTCRIWDSRYSNPSLRVYVPKPPDAVPGRSSNATSSSVPQVHQILCCAYNANGTVFVTGSSDTYARVWSAAFRTNAEDTEQPNHEMDLLSGHENDVNYVQFSGCAMSSKLSTGDTSKEDNLPKFKNSWFTHDNIVTCSRDGSAIIWIPRSRRSHGKVGRWTRAYHLKVPAPPMPPQPPRGGPRQRSQPAPRGVNMIVWSLDNRFVLAAIMDCRICVWNASDGSLVHSLIGHSESTFVLDVHPFNPRIAMSAGYDGKTIIWDIWEGKPVRTYETGRFKLVDGKFSPDGTSVVLSDEVGQIFIIATGQGESQKDAKYDQFFLGDFRPLMQDTHGNTLDQETQLTPYRRNMQDLLCDSSMIPYPEPYQSEYQRRRLGALGIEWRPPSLKFAVGPSNNGDTGEYHQILPIVDLERWIESLEAMPEFVDAMDWEQENEVQSDDNDSEYNVTEEFSSGREHFSLTVSSSGDLGSTGEESEGNHSGREGLRRSRRKNSKAEIAFTTSSGRKVKRRNLDEHDDPTARSRKRKRRNGGSNSKKGSSKSKLHRPQRRAAQNARTFLSQMGGASSEGEEDDDYDTYSSDNDSPIPESNDHSNDSDRSLFDSCAEVARAKEIKRDEQDVSQSSLNEAYSSVGSKRRLVLRLPVRNPKKILSLENAISISDKQNDPMVPSAKCGSTDDKQNEVYSSLTGPGDSCMEKSNNVTSQYATDSILEVEDTGKKEYQPDIAIGCNVGKVRWGEVKTRTAKRVRTGDSSMTDTWHIGSEDPHAVTGVNERHISENGFRASSSYPGNQANGDASFKGECHSEEQLTDCNQDATNVTQNQEPVSINPLVLDHVSANADLIQTDVHVASSNGARRKINLPDELSIEGFRDSDARQLSSPSQDREGNAEPTIRRMIKFTSKRSICGTRSSFSKCTPDINDQRSLDGDLNGTTQAPDNMIPEVAEEDTGSSGSSDHGNWINGSRKFSRMQSSICGRTRSSRGKRSAGEDLHIMEENTSKFGNHDDNQYVTITDNSTAKVHFTRSSGARAITDTLSSSIRRGNYDSAEDAHKIGRSSDASDQFHDDRRSTRRLKVGLRSSRNTRENYVTFGSSSLDKGKGHYLGKKISWLMLAEHDEGYRYIPQLGDEVAYLRQGHAEYLAATKSHESGPWKSLKGELRAVEFCKVVLLDYSTLPGSGESCCKLTLEIVDPSSRFVGKSFRLTLPELVGFPDFLVERTRYNASIERNWTHRDKCRVWWRDGDNEGGQWYEGRITSTKAKSNEFPESPWDRYIIQYKNDSSGHHPHSPWELHDADSHWEHPHIEEEDRRELLSYFHKIEQTTQRNKDSHGLLKLNQVTQKSEFLNRFPVPLSLEVIKRRLENNYYRTVEAVRHDIMVMLSNAESYFSKSAEYAAKMRKLRELITRTFETKQGPCSFVKGLD